MATFRHLYRWRERSGGQISAQPAPLDSPESGHHSHRLLLDHRGAPGLHLRAFFRKSTLRRSTAPGRRWERSGACAMAVPTGQGVGRAWRPPAPRASSTRGLSATSFGVLGLTRARQSFLARQQGRLRLRRQEWSRAFLRCAPHTPSTHARARDIQVCRGLRRERQTGGGSSRGRCLQGVTGRTATARAAEAARLDECSRATTGGG